MNDIHIFEDSEIHNVAIFFYKFLLSIDTPINKDIERGTLKEIPIILNDVDNSQLSKLPMDEKIKFIVFSFEGNKALPGRYGFMHFFFLIY